MAQEHVSVSDISILLVFPIAWILLYPCGLKGEKCYWLMNKINLESFFTKFYSNS